MSWTICNASTATITSNLNCWLHNEMDRLCWSLFVMYLQHVLQVKMTLWQFHDVKLITRDFPEPFVTTMPWTVWNVSTATITGKLNCWLHSEMDRLCWTVCNVSTISWEFSFNVSTATYTTVNCIVLKCFMSLLLDTLGSFYSHYRNDYTDCCCEASCDFADCADCCCVTFCDVAELLLLV